MSVTATSDANQTEAVTRTDDAREVSNDDAKEVVAAADDQSATAVKAEATRALGTNLTADGFDATKSMGLFPGSTSGDAVGDLKSYVAQLDATATPAAAQPGFLQSAGNWVADTAKGYVTGAANMGLGMANLVNTGVNAGLSLTPTDFRFRTDMHLAPTTQTEAAAQNAIEVSSMLAGGYGLARGAIPAVAKGLERLGLARPAAVAGETTAAVAGETTAVVNGMRTWEAAGISAADANRIQATANRIGAPIHVVGSRATGKTTGDWDFIVDGTRSQARNAQRTLPRGFTGGEQTSSGWSGRDVFQTMNPNASGYSLLDTARPYVTFLPVR